jgi:2-methylcitrate dehydratase PrpD
MPESPVAGVTRSVARRAVEPSFGEAPAGAADLGRRTLIDTVGVAVAARGEPAVAAVRELIGRGSDDASTVLVDGSAAAPAEAAFINGVAAHALDYDDVVDHIYGHPSTVLWPALLAAGEAHAASTRQLIEAYLTAFDVEMALAEGFAVREHYARGWHSTATLGVVAAAAGVSRLLGNTARQTASALGIAASMAGGSRQNFGTMTKPLHAGLAARDGVLAASLAARGFSADPDQLEGPLGYFALYGDRSRLDRVLRALDHPTGTAIVREGVNVKKYPACYNTQRTIDAALSLASRPGIRADEITRISLTVEPGGFDPLIHHRPTTGLQGKFSGEYAVAAALTDGTVNLATYTDDMVRRPEVGALLDTIKIAESRTPPTGKPEWDHAYAVVEVELRSGNVEVARVDVPSGDRRAPLSATDIRAKFEDCLDFAGYGMAAEPLLSRLMAFGTDQPFEGLQLIEHGFQKRR